MPGVEAPSPPVVVCDAGPLIALGRLDQLALLNRLFKHVQVPDAVIKECLARPGNADAQRIQSALKNGWLHACSASDVDLPGLDLGERAAISRALTINATLLADDQAARQQARALGLAVMGTLGVLVLGKRAGLVEAVGPMIESLRASGQRLGHEAVQQVLRAAGEAPP